VPHYNFSWKIIYPDRFCMVFLILFRQISYPFKVVISVACSLLFGGN
jgi:hypothetical protein